MSSHDHVSPRRRRLVRACQNVLLIVGSLIFLFLVMELIVFRLLLPATDLVENAMIDGIIRHEPNQSGISRRSGDFAAPFAINEQGWNSGHPSYSLSRQGDVARIAIIGDSYVEALQVPFDASFAELTEAGLRENGCPAEVYRFGITGAPLSQHLHVLENEVVDYAPDWLVILLIHNDFDESFVFKPGRYRSSFLKLKIEDGEVVDEIAPRPYETDWKEWVRASATFRYLYYNHGISPQSLRSLVADSEPINYQANIDVDAVMADLGKIEVAVDYLLERISAIAERHGIELLLLMDGHREAIYGLVEENRTFGPLALNEVVSASATRHGVTFIDLHQHFAADWQERARRFEYETDAHWNEMAHRLVADVVAGFLSPRCP